MKNVCTEEVLKFLRKHCNGFKNAKFGNDIASMIGIENRTLRDAISKLRQEGICIASDTSVGYWYTTNKKVLLAWIEKLKITRNGIDTIIRKVSSNLR